MTHTDAEYTESCLSATEEDAVLDEAARVVLDAEPPFDSQLGHPAADLLALLPAEERMEKTRQASRLLYADLRALLETERPGKYRRVTT